MTNRIVIKPITPNFERIEFLRKLDRPELEGRLTKINSILTRETEAFSREKAAGKIVPGTILKVVTKDDRVFHLRYLKHHNIRGDVLIQVALSSRQMEVPDRLYAEYKKSVDKLKGDVTFVPTSLAAGFAASSVKSIQYLHITDKTFGITNGRKCILEGKSEYRDVFKADARKMMLAQREQISMVLKERKPFIPPPIAPKPQVVRFHMGTSKIRYSDLIKH